MTFQPRHNDLDEIKEGLKGRIEEVCRRCLPAGRREGKEWVAHNPYVDEARKAPALKVALTGNKGAWRDWRNGDKGDVLKLVEFTQGCDLKGALVWARDFLGLQNMTPREREDFRRRVADRQKREAAEDEKNRRFKLERARERFYSAPSELGLLSGPEQHARAYFRARKCPLEDVKHPGQGTFRFSPATSWWKGAEWRHEAGRRMKVKDGPEFPAIHTAMRQMTGIITCCHVTFLDPVRPAKAPVEPAKLMFGEALGAVIEVATGPSLKSFWHPDAPAGPVIICEGIETGLSIAVAVPEARVWAGGSLAGMGHAPVSLPCVSDITVARDNNHGNPQAQAALGQALARLDEAGKPLVVMSSHLGDDFNDLIKGE
jgi:hypothetical protein